MLTETENNLIQTDKEMLSSLEKFVDRTSEAFELLEVISDKSGNAVDFKFLKVNSAFEKQTGLKAENIIGKLKKEHAPAPEPWYDIAINAVKTGKTLNYEYYNDKINRYCETLFIPISANQIVVTFKDTTERKMAQNKLQESERKYRALVDATNTGYLILDKQGKVIDANEEYVRLSGHSELREIIGKSVLEWTAEFDKEKNRGAVDRCLKDGFINDLIIHYVGNSGIVPLEINAAVANLGSSVQIVSLCRDVSEREKAETKLKESEEKFKALVERLPEMVLEIDTAGKVIFANSRVIEITGYSREELESNFDANRFVTEEDAVRSRQNMKLSFSGEMRHSNEYSFVKKDGTRFPVLLNSVPITKNGKIVGIRGIIVDLTELKKLQNQLKENERLAAIGATAGWVGHDIRNPLQAMLSDAYLLTDYLASVPDSPAKKEAIESLQGFEGNIGYINKIVADLQDYSRPLKPELINVNLYELVTSVFIPFDLPENLNPSIDIDPKLIVKSDPVLLKRILTNLIINAIQAMPDGGKLVLSCHPDAHKVAIMVEDTGVGIPDTLKSRIFTPMVTTKSKGQGLGLAVVKRLVEALKGTISYESEVGKGTKFIIEMPVNN